MMVKGMVFVDSTEYALVSAYCAGKGCLWNAFFGWRKTDKAGYAHYVLPRKVWQELATIEGLLVLM